MVAFLQTGAIPVDDISAKWQIHMSTEDTLRRNWEAVRDVLLREWVEENPGTRPRAWWIFDAPRWRTDYNCCGKSFAEPRLRLGGVGTPCYEALNYVPEFEYGLPLRWIDQGEVDYYNGRTLKRGDARNAWTRELREGRFPHAAYDPMNPPLFESEAAYLKRHGLLLPGEAARLTPPDFEPEVIDLGDEPEGEIERIKHEETEHAD